MIPGEAQELTRKENDMICGIGGRELSRSWVNHFAPGAQDFHDVLLAHGKSAMKECTLML